MSAYTVIINDYAEHVSFPVVKAIQVTAESPESAAGVAEVVVATEIWKRRYPELGEPHEQDPRMDDEWIDCMEAAGTLAVIEGNVKTWIADEIYDPAEDN